MKFIYIPGWEKYQHYQSSTRPTVWIKVYLRLMSNLKFRALPDATKYHLIALWMVAVGTKNCTPLDQKDITGVSGCKSNKINFQSLVDSEFIIIINADTENSARKMIAKIEQNDRAKSGHKELEKELEKEKEVDVDVDKKKKPASEKPEQPKQPIWSWWVDINRELGRSDPARSPVDLGHVKHIQALGYDDDMIKSMLRKYLLDQDRYLIGQGHPLRHFAGRVNKYLNKNEPRDNRGGNNYEDY